MTSLLILIFWICFLIVGYTYLGYGLLLYAIIKIKRFFTSQKPLVQQPEDWPEVTLVVAAYNEADFIEAKIQNSLSQIYPREKIQFLYITDGSDDRTPEIIQQYPEVRLMHQQERAGKIAAMHRAMPTVTTPITVFSDANALLNPEAIQRLVQHYSDPKVGAVAGEKRIRKKDADNASGAGEGLYWKYESTLKRWDAEWHSAVGAAGELFSIRTELYEHIPEDTLIEDFYLTLRIAMNGYRIAYESEAYATEAPSASVAEELKRKTRISAGAFQAIGRLKSLLNPFQQGVLSIQYLSHRVLRWTLAPLSLPLLFIINLALAVQGLFFYQLLFLLQVLFYLAAIGGYFLERRHIRFKPFFVPFYFCFMNYAVFMGFVRFLRGRQSVLWERAERGE